MSDLGLEIQTLTEEKATTTDADDYLREFEVVEAAIMSSKRVDYPELTNQDKELRQYHLKYSWRILLELLTYKMTIQAP